MYRIAQAVGSKLNRKEGGTLKKRKAAVQIIVAPHYAAIDGPLIFLAGPIRGTTEWQKEAIQYIQNINAEMNIASPRRPDLTENDFSDDIFDEQVNWEHFHLKRAGENGVILFWLAKETIHRCDRSYAQTTRFELGESVAMHHFLGVRVVVGVEEGFSNEKYIRNTLGKKYPGIPICNTLQETCETAINLAARQRKEARKCET